MGRKRKRSWTADALCRLDADCVPMGVSEKEIDFSLGINSKQRRVHRRRHTVLTAISAAGDYLRTQFARRSLSQPTAPSGKSPVQGRLASSARCSRHRMCDPPASRNRRPTPGAARAKHPSLGERPTARRSLPAREPVKQILFGSQQKVSNNRPDEKSDEFDADVVPFLPKFPLVELVFAHCPYQPRRPIRLALLKENRRHRVRRQDHGRLLSSRGVSQLISPVMWQSTSVVCSPL